MVAVHADLPGGLMTAVATAAARMDVSHSEVIRLALAEWLARTGEVDATDNASTIAPNLP
jgi:hypothetical protein